MNVVGSALPLMVALVTVPAYLDIFGEVRYGIWLVAWALFGYAGVIDLGLGRATANSVARLRSNASRDRERVVWTGVVVNLGFGVVAGALILAATELAVRRFDGLGGIFHSELVAALPWLAVSVPLFVVTSVLIGALEGVEQFLVVNVVGVLGTVSAQGFPLAAGFIIAPRLDILAAATALALLLGTTLAAVACSIYVPVTARPRFDRARAGTLLRFGGWITVTSMISPLLSTLDKLIIGAVSGARAVTYYTVPFNLVTKLWILPASLARSLFPRFSRLSGAHARSLAAEASRALSAIMTPVTVVGILAVDPFMRAWVGTTFASVAAMPAEILLLGLWVNSLAFVPYTLLQAEGRPDVPAKLHLLELLPFVAILWLGVEFGGVTGAAIAWSARVFFDTSCLMIASRYRPRSQAYLIPGAILVFAAFALAQISTDLSERSLVGVLLLSVVLFWSWVVAPPSLRRYALRLLPRLWPAATR
jgi:O-antigen/teichoic acid export membrane protein